MDKLEVFIDSCGEAPPHVSPEDRKPNGLETAARRLEAGAARVGSRLLQPLKRPPKAG